MTDNNNNYLQIDIDLALDKILPKIIRPSRYIGGEPNSAHKFISDVDVSVALAFPDIYEVGMSNLGLKILYSILNSDSRISAERVYAPAEDMERLMRENKVPLFALESRRPVIDFDILGFSLSYELSYTAVLNMLDLSGIHLFSAERSQGEPIVIAGGHCTSNPEPMADFIDAFVVGDGEDVVLELVEAVRSSKGVRQDILKSISEIRGVYVPSIHGRIAAQQTIYHRAVASLENAPYPDTLIVPHTEVVHDRVVLEILRGCTRGCRFCQAGMLTRPVRERSVETLASQAERLLRGTGYDEVALSSLSSADYSKINELVGRLIDTYEKERIGISLPSLRADAECVELAAQIQRVRKSGLTFAPEAGSQRLRDVINKNINESDLLGAIEAAVINGWKRVKLYFMIGLPTETDEDIEDIAKLVHLVLAKAREHGVKLTLSLTISPFVPKPHTPFQWHGMPSTEELERRIALLRSLIRSKNVQISWHEPSQSRVEAALARGGKEVGAAIYAAWRQGVNLGQIRFDSQKWDRAFADADLSIENYAGREFALDEPLPWDFVNTGVSKEFLLREYHRAVNGIKTSDCRDGSCSACGVKESLDLAKCPPKPPVSPEKTQLSSPKKGIGEERLVVFRFCKAGRAKWLGHLDLVRAFERAVRISGVDVVYSEGFNPRPRIALLSALPLGATAGEEVFTIRLRPGEDFIGIINRLNAALPEGIRVYDVSGLKDTTKPPLVLKIGYLVRMGLPECRNCDEVAEAIELVMSKDTIEVHREKKGRVKTVDLRTGILSMHLNELEDEGLCELAVMLEHGDFTPRPSEIVELLRQHVSGLQMVSLHRNRVVLENANRRAAERAI